MSSKLSGRLKTRKKRFLQAEKMGNFELMAEEWCSIRRKVYQLKRLIENDIGIPLTEKQIKRLKEYLGKNVPLNDLELLFNTLISKGHVGFAASVPALRKYKFQNEIDKYNEIMVAFESMFGKHPMNYKVVERRKRFNNK